MPQKTKVKPIVMTPYEATLYQQGHMWGGLGFSLSSRDATQYKDNPSFLKGYNDAVSGITPNFSPNVSTVAFYRGV